MWALAAIAQGLGDGYPDRVTRLADEAEHVARYILDRGMRDRAYADIARALAAVGQASLAIKIVRNIYEYRIRQRAYADIARALAAAGHADHAINVVHYIYEPVEHGIRSDGSYDRGFRAQVYADIAQALAAVGHADRAFETTHYIYDSEIKRHAYAEIAKALAQVSRWEAARIAACKIAEPQYQVQVLNDVATTLLKSSPSAMETKDKVRPHLHLILGTALASEHWAESLAILGRVAPEAVMALHERMTSSHRVTERGISAVDENSSKQADKARPLIFLCHASEDKQAVRSFRSRLLEAGFEVWLDEDKILPGQDWDSEIRHAIKRSSSIVIFLSQASQKRGYLQKELRRALDEAELQPDGAIFLIPARLEPCEVPESLGRLQWVDLWVQEGFERLCRSLETRRPQLH